MEYIAIGFLTVLSLVVAYSIYVILKSIRFTIEDVRYTYVTEKDEYGNEYEKVIDHTDDNDREWKWKV